MNNINSNISIGIKIIHEDAKIPKYQHSSDSGFDLISIEDILIGPHKTKLIRTGLSFVIPESYEIQIRPRSGLSLKTDLRIPNSPGTIDSGFLGELKVIVHNSGSGTLHIQKGDRFAQAVLCPVLKAEFIEVDKLDSLKTSRGFEGFGSTGIKENI